MPQAAVGGAQVGQTPWTQPCGSAQQYVEVVQPFPLTKQSAQRPFTQLPLQQSAVVEQAWPLAAQAGHRPCEQ